MAIVRTHDLMVICSWCQEVQHRGNGDRSGATHTICPKCKAKMDRELDAMDAAKIYPITGKEPRR